MKQYTTYEKLQCEEVTGAGHVIQCLKKLGVTTVFGYPGGAILPVYDALYESGLKHILTRHEQAAIHAAEGYARASGKVGVVFATSGPGDEFSYRLSRCLYGFDSFSCHYRASCNTTHWKRRVSRS